MNKPLTILLLDNDTLPRQQLASQLCELGYLIQLADTIDAAMAACAIANADLVLVACQQDNNTRTIHRIRQQSQRWLPVILLLPEHDALDYQQVLACGADDYLENPPTPAQLALKLNSIQQLLRLQTKLLDHQLQQAQEHSNAWQEHVLASHVLGLFNSRTNLQAANTQSWLKPAEQLSGDVICSARSPSGCDHFMLADSTGHGLVAAICCLPAIDTFHGMSRRGFGIAKIAESINRKLRQSLPTGHFVAAAIVSIDYERQTLSIWNGGIPFCVFIDNQSKQLHEFRSCHPPLGALPTEQFDGQLVQHDWQGKGQLIICSDGITEARNTQQQHFGNIGVLQAIADGEPENAADRIASAWQQHLGTQKHQDDASLLVIDCHPQYTPPVLSSPSPRPPLQRWQFQLGFTRQELLHQESQTTIIEWLNRPHLPAHQFNDILNIIRLLCQQAQHTTADSHFVLDIGQFHEATVQIHLHLPADCVMTEDPSWQQRLPPGTVIPSQTAPLCVHYALTPA